jgi:hypothetical protein
MTVSTRLLVIKLTRHSNRDKNKQSWEPRMNKTRTNKETTLRDSIITIRNMCDLVLFSFSPKLFNYSLQIKNIKF